MASESDTCCGCNSSIISAKLITNNFSQIDEYLDSGKVDGIKRGIDELEYMLKEYTDSPELLWRLGKAYSKLATITENPTKKRENINKGIDFCTQALQLNCKCAEVHKWYAILIGSRGDFQSPKERIADGFEFKRHIDLAIDLNPHDPSLYHLLGRFSYELAGLKWYEKKIATALFGEMPTSTYEEALSHFMMAEDMSKDEWKENKLLIGKCHIAKGDVERGVDWLVEADNISAKSMEEHVDKEIQNLLNKYNNHSR